MKEMKRILAMVLCLVMVVGMVPMTVFAADGEKPVASAVFASDIHDSNSTLSSVMSGVAKSGLTYSTATFVGDSFSDSKGSTSTYTSTVQGKLGSSVAVYYTYGDHDAGSDVKEDTYLVHSGDYYIYAISDADMRSKAGATADGVTTEINEFKSDVAAMDKTKPLFIASHAPLHERRNDNTYANEWYTAITEVAAKMDVVFFWAHNHTSESSVDQAAFYVAKNGSETITIEGGSTVTPNFTYMNAGYVAPANNDTERQGVATSVEIYSDSMTFTVYDSNGVYSGNHAVTESVDRQFAVTTPTLTSIDVTGTTEYIVGEELDLTVSATYSDGSVADVTADATLTGADMSAADSYTVTASYDDLTDTIDITVGELKNIEITTLPTKVAYKVGDEFSTDGMVVSAVYTNGIKREISTWRIDSKPDMATAGEKEVTVKFTKDGLTYSATFTITVEEGPKAEETLTAIEVVTNPTKTEYLVSDKLDITGMVVQATFSGGTVLELDYAPFTDDGDGYTVGAFCMYHQMDYNAVVSYTYGDVTCTDTFPVNVWEEDFSDSDVSVHVTEIGIVGITADESANETVETAIADVIKAGTYEAYDIDLTFYEGYTTTNAVATVTLPIPEGVTNPVVYYVSEDGKTVTNMNATKGDGVVTFKTNHFSTYVVGETTELVMPEPETATGSGTITTTTKKTIYKLVSSLTAGEEYLIVSRNTAGSGYGLAGSTTGQTVTVKDADDVSSVVYIEDKGDALEWTASSGWSFASDDYDLGYSSGLSFSTEDEWTFNSNRLYQSVRNGRNTYTYYLRCNSGTWSASTTSSNVYFYQRTEVDVETTTTVSGTYSIAGTPAEITKVVTEGSTADLGSTLTFTPTSGTATTTDTSTTATYAVVENGDPNGIISGISGNTVTFTGKTGKALVKVSYTDTVGSTTYTVDNYIVINASEPYYSIDLHKADVTYTEATGLTKFAEGTIYYISNGDGTYTQVDTDVTTAPESGVTYYTLSFKLGDEITAPIAIKGIEEGDRYGVWAVVKYYDGITEDGTDMGTVGSDIEWSSSDETIATVDKNTGIITFTGKEGTVNITATYLDGNKPSDTITISVTQSQYSVPADGTNDFPEYPNEGAIRFDKTATAVGNFSETGIAKVELSMTGVPYTTGSELDVVLMLDQSTSMDAPRISATVAATKAFINSIVINEDGTFNSNRIYVGYFNGSKTYDITDAANIGGDLTTIDSQTELDALFADIDDEFDGSPSTSGTEYGVALEKCYTRLNTAKTDGVGNDRQQFCVFMSDGVPTTLQVGENSMLGTSGNTQDGYPAMKGMFTGTDYDTRSSSYQYEYYSTQMKAAGVTVYTVGLGLEAKNNAWSAASATQCLNAASLLLNDIAGPAKETTKDTGSTLSKKDSYFFSVEDATAAADMENVFKNIAMKILQAATDITVEDKITDEYTMIFDIPTGSQSITGVSNDFYIEFVKYTLDNNHERTDSGTSVTKLYLENTNGVYSAAKDSDGTDYDAPVFAQTTIGEKGTLYYWTTDPNYASKAAVSYTSGSTTYYFIPYGMEANEDGTAPSGWYNMTSGGYAYGTVDSTNMSDNLVIATPYFVYNASTKMLYWTVDKLDTTEYALRYFLYLDNSATEVGTGKEVDPGSYQTNEYAHITYTNFHGNDCRQKFPVPQLTWSGAQVSYVFYLVNAAGQPINKSGQVVDFANATFVTDVYTENTVWNKGEDGSITADSQLSIEWLADELLPSDYEVYDENARYKLHVYGTHEGDSIFDYFIIGGNEASAISTSLNSRLGVNATTADTVSLTTTKVYNTKAGQKVAGYGTYTSKATDSMNDEVVLSGFDFYNTTVAFAVVWQPSLAPDTIVVDYGLDVLINVLENDLMQYSNIKGIGKSTTNMGTANINNGVYDESKLTANELTLDNGDKVAIENDRQIRFSQGDMIFDEPVSFYYESEVDYYKSSEKHTGYMYSSVTVIPATTVYYEDNFSEAITYTSYTRTLKEDGTYSEYSDDKNIWETAGTAINATQDQDRPGTTLITGVVDANNVYGYDSAYTNMTTWSMGSAKKIHVDANQYGTAEFTFTGTGFDVISMTDSTTGTLVVQVYEGEVGDGEKPIKSLVVDTYYGYVYDDANDEWILYSEMTDEQKAAMMTNAIMQVPVMQISGLTYGQYTVKITALYYSATDQTSEAGYDLYLDAIRIYDPIATDKTVSGSITVESVYKQDEEGWPIYQELRNNVIDAAAAGETNGIVFVDGVGETAVVSDYTNYGPNNELYLAPGQAIGFNLDLSAFETYDSDGNLTKNTVAAVQLGIKSADGNPVTYKIFDAATVASADDLSNVSAATVNTATDMYYDIYNLRHKTIVIVNTGNEGILSLTDIKLTFTEDPPAVTNLLYVTGETVNLTLKSLNDVPEDERFDPATFNVYCANSAYVGNRVNVSVETSSDVAAITVNDVEYTKYYQNKISGKRIWTTKLDVVDAENINIVVVAYDVNGTPSDPISHTIEVTDASSTTINVSAIKNVVNQILGWLKG